MKDKYILTLGSHCGNWLSRTHANSYYEETEDECKRRLGEVRLLLKQRGHKLWFAKITGPFWRASSL